MYLNSGLADVDGNNLTHCCKLTRKKTRIRTRFLLESCSWIIAVCVATEIGAHTVGAKSGFVCSKPLSQGRDEHSIILSKDICYNLTPFMLIMNIDLTVASWWNISHDGKKGGHALEVLIDCNQMR